jgi:hypothetical protein
VWGSVDGVLKLGSRFEPLRLGSTSRKMRVGSSPGRSGVPPRDIEEFAVVEGRHDRPGDQR